MSRLQWDAVKERVLEVEDFASDYNHSFEDRLDDIETETGLDFGG
jgi:hypothetical protein